MEWSDLLRLEQMSLYKPGSLLSQSQAEEQHWRRQHLLCRRSLSLHCECVDGPRPPF